MQLGYVVEKRRGTAHSALVGASVLTQLSKYIDSSGAFPVGIYVIGIHNARVVEEGYKRSFQDGLWRGDGSG